MRLIAAALVLLFVMFDAWRANAAIRPNDVRIALTGDARRPDGDVLHYAVTLFRYVPHEPGLSAAERSRATVFVATCTVTDGTAQIHATAQRFGRAGFDRFTSRGYDADVDVASWVFRSRVVNGMATLHLEIDDANLNLELDARGAFAVGMPFVPPMQTSGQIDGVTVKGNSTLAFDSRPDVVDGTIRTRMFALVHITGDRGVHTIRILRFNEQDDQTEATMIDPDGRVTRFRPGDVRMSFHGDNLWASPATSRIYPTIWQVTIAKIGVFMSISPAMTDQEFLSVPRADAFWEGAVLVQPLDPAHQVYGDGVVTVTGRRSP